MEKEELGTLFDQEKVNYNELKHLDELLKNGKCNDGYIYNFVKALNKVDLIWMRSFVEDDETYQFGFDVLDLISYVEKEKGYNSKKR